RFNMALVVGTRVLSLRSESFDDEAVARRDHLAEVRCIHALADELNRAVAHQHMCSAGMKAVQAATAIVRAVDEARAAVAAVRTVIKRAGEPVFPVERVTPAAARRETGHRPVVLIEG